MANALFRAIRVLTKIDSGPTRRALFQTMLAQNRKTDLIYNWFQQSSESVRTGLSVCYAVSANPHVLYVNEQKIIAAYKSPHERQAILNAIHLLAGDPAEYRHWWHFKNALGQIRAWSSVYRISRGLCRRHDLFVAMRATQLVWLYVLYSKRLYNSIWVSTDGNPHGLALLSLAQQRKIPSFFLSHGAIPLEPTPVECTLGVFYGPAASTAYLNAGARFARHIFYGSAQSANDFKDPHSEAVCICLSKNFSAEPLLQLVRKLQSLAITDITIRLHPNSLVPLNSISGARIVQHDELADALQDRTCVFAGNSTVHLDALKLGVSSIYLRSLDSHDPKKLSFLEEGLIESEELKNICRDTIKESRKRYRSPEWRAEFARFVDSSSTTAEYKTNLQNIYREVLCDS